jgi:Uma2 family endonuclease
MVQKTSRPARLVTADELLEMPEGFRELIRGEVVELGASGFDHSGIGFEVGRCLGNHARAHDLGRVVGADCGFILERNPDTVRAPDVGFIRKERAFPTSKFFPFAPDLAVEVVSPSDRYTKVMEKVRCWLDHGTEEVWVIDIRRRTATIHRRDGVVIEIKADGVIEGGELLPGFRLPLRELFAGWPPTR